MSQVAKTRVLTDPPVSPVVEQLLAGQVELVPWEHLGGRTDESIEGIYTFSHPTVDGELLDRLPSVKIVSNHGVGVDHIDVAAADARSIRVTNTPGVLDEAVADMALTLLLAAGRRLAEGDRFVRSGTATHFDPNSMLGREIHGSTLGIIGLGAIGEAVARRALAFNMQILYHNRNRRPQAEDTYFAEYCTLDDLLARADYVVLVVPLTEETRGLIGARELALMKPTATLVNIARGPVVDTDALTATMQAGRIYAAALDVTDPEPLPAGHPLLCLDNVTFAPHLGSATEQTRRRMAEVSIEQLLAGLRGEKLTFEVRP